MVRLCGASDKRGFVEWRLWFFGVFLTPPLINLIPTLNFETIGNNGMSPE
jgi:hypothetical protein